MLTEKCVVADGAWFGKCVELVQPFSGDVKLQQAGLLHTGQGHDFLPLPHRLLAALSAQIHMKHSKWLQDGTKKGEPNWVRWVFPTLTCRTTHRLLRSAQPSHGLLSHTGHRTRTTGRWSHSDSKQCSGHLKERKCTWQSEQVGMRSYLQEMMVSHTSCSAMVTNDWQQVVSGDLRRTVLGQERLHVQTLQREGNVAADLERVHHLMPKAFQVNAQNLHRSCWKKTNKQTKTVSSK